MEGLRISIWQSWSDAEEDLHLNWDWLSLTEQMQNLFHLVWLIIKARNKYESNETCLCNSNNVKHCIYTEYLSINFEFLVVIGILLNITSREML